MNNYLAGLVVLVLAARFLYILWRLIPWRACARRIVCWSRGHEDRCLTPVSILNLNIVRQHTFKCRCCGREWTLRV